MNLKNAPQKIWNADETGKQLEHFPVNVVARKGAKNVVGRPKQHYNDGMCECLWRKLPPMLVVKGKTKKSLYGYITTDAPEIRCGLSMIVLVLMRSWESNGLKTYFSPTAGTNVLTPHP